ncbi:hypothetical protein SARC_16082 [Sphaeroforma arctica JP610]|uniref:Uncharacterized protein n=1 Tax=Sphaeroforma arctica JP610 TaxID=667725 RepID=A0A0L0F5B6_9EUKA|nr:hypothetical protein SARC_16082 [Sphaeroforma arctica JP610]KNC71378.1 hypothetical protein SARC_16082 [Sphaeroforma arctica JP610]|eukprot:XP_014145280.1 hypothetical protein SARC_16082 [Sphaeroforma arctica JP610]
MHIHVPVYGFVSTSPILSSSNSIDGNYLENHGLNRTDTLLKADNYTWAPLPASVIAPPQWLREMNRGNDMHWAEDINSIALLLKDGFDKKDCVGVERVIKQYFDVDQLVDYIAINTILLEGDQTYHNYLLHRRQGEVKWRHFFWDKDGALDLFRSPQKIKNYNTFKFGVSYKNGVMVHLRYQPNYLLQNFLNAKGMYEKVHKKVLEFTDKKTGLLNGKRFTTTISNFSKRVRPFVEKGKADKITHKVFDAEIKRLKKVYAHPEKLWEEFEVKWWGKNGTAPTCGEWS